MTKLAFPEFPMVRWFKNGDHPFDACMGESPSMNEDPTKTAEGRVVRRFCHPGIPADYTCNLCGYPMQKHGWIDNAQVGHKVCPGDWIAFGFYPIHPYEWSIESDDPTPTLARREARQVEFSFDDTAKTSPHQEPLKKK